MKPWYQIADTFKVRLLEHNGALQALADHSGIPRTTLSYWKGRHGIVIEPTGGIVSPDNKLVGENEVLRLENKRLRSHATSQAAGDVEAERLILRLEEAIGTWSPKFEAVPLPPKDNDRTAQDLVLQYSDLHAAEVVSLEETRGLNEYNWDIMLGRMENVKSTVFSHVEHFGFDVNTFHIHMLGDMLSGNIHAELAMTNDRPLAQAVIDLAEAHIPWLLGFAEYFMGSKVKVAGVPGNHPRAWVKPQAKMAHDNADWLFYKTLELALRGHPQFEFDFPRGAMNEQIIAGRWRNLLLHGDGIRSSMPGVPWGGVARRITTLEAQFTAARKPIDYFELGHFHTTNQVSGVNTKTYMNGSLKGIDEYSLKQFGSGRPAEQALQCYHPKYGCTGTYSVQLQDRIPAGEGWG